MLILLRKIEGKSSDQAEAGPNSPSSSSFSKATPSSSAARKTNGTHS